MKQKNAVLILVAALAAVLIGALPGLCTSNAELEQRIEKLERNAGGSAGGSAIGQISEWVTLTGTIEVAVTSENYDVDNDEDNDDISLATGELGIEAKPQDWVTGYMLLSWEDDDDKITLDEAHITLGATDSIPYYLMAGRIYVPFGAYETMMISDPITQDLGEVRDEAIQVGIEVNGFRAAAYLFNGEAEDDDDESIDVYGVSVGYTMETDDFSFDIGLDWINNVLESGGLKGAFDDANDDLADRGLAAAELDDQVPGWAIHAMVTFGPICVIGEYVALTDEVEFSNYPNATWDEASAYALEAGYTFDLSGFETTLAIGYQASDDAEGLLPEEVYLFSVGVGLTDNLSVAAEYRNAEDYDDAEEIDTYTLQLTFEF